MRARPNVVLLVIAVLVAALAVIAAVVSANRTPSGPDPATPEWVVQEYLVATFQGDQAKMATLLDPALGCQPPFQYFDQPPQGSLTVVSSRTSGATASVVAEISIGAGGPFPGGASVQRQTFDLVHLDGRWLITGHPWPLYACKGN